jgi:FkbM family methyltransferase
MVNIENICKTYFNFDNGVFIEVGASDGNNQSNTNFLEKHRNWTGVLIEPNIDAYNTCVTNRQKSKVYNCALVDYDFSEPEIEMYFRSWISGDPGLVTSAFDSPINTLWGDHNYSYKIAARTLDNVLEEANLEKIDFFSLDVEGYELKVLQGFNFEKYKPTFILVESHKDLNEIDKIRELLHCYYVIEEVTQHDYLFRYKD